MNINAELPTTWLEIDGDKRFTSYCALLDIDGSGKTDNGIKPYIKMFYKNPDGVVPVNGDIVIYHEERGSWANHHPVVNLGYYYGDTVYILPNKDLKAYIYKLGLISREQYSGSGDHIAALRIAIAIRNLEKNPEKLNYIYHDENAPEKLKIIASLILNK